MKQNAFSARKISIISFLSGVVLTLTATNAGAVFRGSAVFRDVPANHYADEAIGEMYNLGIIKGLDSAHFGPDQPLTRGQAALLFQRLRNELRGVVSSSRSSASSRSSSSSSTTSSSSSSSSYNPAGHLRFDSASYNVDENSATRSFTVGIVRIGGNVGTVSVNYAFSGGTAVPGTDYTPISGTLTFATKETSKKLVIQIFDDTVPDGNKTVNLVLSNPTGGASLGNPSQSVLNIIDNETAQTSSSTGVSSSASSAAGGTISLSASTYGVLENGTNITITVQRTGNTSAAVGIGYATGGGTAIAGTDYATMNGTLSFAAGETVKTFSIPVVDNGQIEGDRTVNITLTGPTGGAVLGSPSTAVLSIMDDETQFNANMGSGSVRFSSATFTASEGQGNAVITVRRIGSLKPMSVNYATNGGSAVPGVDYTAVSGTLSFVQGETSKIFLIPLVKKAVSSGGKTIMMSLSSPTNNVPLADPSFATLTISE